MDPSLLPPAEGLPLAEGLPPTEGLPSADRLPPARKRRHRTKGRLTFAWPVPAASSSLAAFQKAVSRGQ
jgi:hypothetical protein